MQSLLPYFERELGFLRRNAREFAEAHPKVAGRLLMSGETVEDPHVERMIESFALIASRIHKKLDDDYPQFTEALLDVLYPHYLRPFPSCSIARFEAGPAAAQLTRAVAIERHTALATRPAKGVACKFRTAYPVHLAPVAIEALRFSGLSGAPAGFRLPADCGTVLSFDLRLTSPQAEWSKLGLPQLRVFLDADPALVAVLRDALLLRVAAVAVEPAQSHRWTAVADRPRAVGYAEDEALIDFDARSHPAYRLLTEFFAFPAKFDFIDLPLATWTRSLPPGCRSVRVHLLLSGLRADSDEARLLEGLTAANLQLGCTPVVNLFKQVADPIRVTHQQASYPVVADSRRAWAYDIYSVDSVQRVQAGPQGEVVQRFEPFYSLRHEQHARDGGRFYHLRRDETVAETSPGWEHEITVVDLAFDPATPTTDTLSIELTCSNRDLPSQLAFGLAGGDLFKEGGSPASSITLLRRPTRTWRFERGGGAQWRLISHLSLNHLSLADQGVEALRETLRLYDLPRSPLNEQLIEAIVAADREAATAWLPGQPFPALIRGLKVRITVDDSRLRGVGPALLAGLLDHFLGLYVHANSFVQTVLVSQRTGREIVTCPPKSGSVQLL